MLWKCIWAIENEVMFVKEIGLYGWTCHIVAACVTLHNTCENIGDSFIEEW